ncbi:hypothetical protein T03_16935 [Trichinella britovi]|uniref:Uncharacterized protein n=1 Tax=Trichinella britovi TaxID=45882 RepID=A0A0V1CDL0_TRIBR|nr:hypothetical protein T03_16935 [Trichinella britovi]
MVRMNRAPDGATEVFRRRGAPGPLACGPSINQRLVARRLRSAAPSDHQQPAGPWVNDRTTRLFAVLPRAAASRDTASAGRNELLDSAFYPSSSSPGTYSSPVSSALRTDHSSTLLAWSCPRLASTPGRLAHTRVCGLCCPSRNSGAVARAYPFPDRFV